MGHLPIYVAATDFLKELYLRIPKFAKQYKYMLGEKLLGYSVEAIRLITIANKQRGDERRESLARLAGAIDLLLLHVRLGEELSQWGNQKAYLLLSEKLVHISTQAEGWRRSTVSAR